MKRNKLFIAGLVTVFLALVSLTLVSSTWAKYTSTATGSDSARVAKWSFIYDGEHEDAEDAAKVSTISFDLFKTIKDEDGTSETDVDLDGDGTEKVIAPGTSGSFTFEIQNKSEVTAQYALDYTITNTNNIPLLFKVNDGEWTSSLADVVASDATKLGIGSEAKTFTIEWKWAFEGNDSGDTTLGQNAVNADQTIIVELEITMTQVD